MGCRLCLAWLNVDFREWMSFSGNLWFLGKSRSNPLCMGEGVDVGLVWPGQTSTFGS